MANAKTLPDLPARLAALTVLDRSLLVEAGAGSGKTAIIAGRVAMLLAEGVEPKRIAAITFTEFAASELLIRITRFVEGLAKGAILPEIAIAFPDGVSSAHQANLERAQKSLDQLLCSTIHGFAQALIKPYPVEAGIDPGAEIVDPTEADLAFAERYDAWLRNHLSGERNDDIVAELVLADQGAALDLISELAEFRRHNRDARPAPASWAPSVLDEFNNATRSFRSMLARLEFQEPSTDDRAKDFADLADKLCSPALCCDEPTNRALVEAVLIERPGGCFGKSGPLSLRTKGKWQAAAAESGRSKAEGVAAFEAARAHYDACHEACKAVMAMIAGTLLVRLSASMDRLLAEWREYKNAAALLDFDDLLYTARDLLAGHEEVRKALTGRFQHVLVDEFQDTDPLQIDILWRLCGERQTGKKDEPLSRRLRPGVLFLVGDPKQAIYRFRGADVNAYVAARTALGRDGLLAITANFRSVGPILSFVNDRFRFPLSAEGQPGFSELTSTCEANGPLTVAALDVLDGETATANEMRDAEAERVAELCSRLVGNLLVRDRDENGRETMHPCRLGDIALLAPTGTELWRFEQALEGQGLAVSTQAGKGFFRRQEIHDLIALARTLADDRDTLALGALLRGPLVGLTEAELLDVAEALPVDPKHPARLPQLNLWTDPGAIGHDVAREVIGALQALVKHARSTTPHALLSDAICLLDLRSQLRQRLRASADRALANVDLFLEMSRNYSVRGLRAFASDMQANWEEAIRQVEGRPDAEEQSIALITIHASKGLEWPVVIPINMTGAPRGESGLMHDRRTEQFSVPLLGAKPSDYEAIKALNARELDRERVRLWYVAATRARDLLTLPRHSCALREGAYARIVDLDLPALEAIDPGTLGTPIEPSSDGEGNAQTREVFAEQAGSILRAHRRIEWCQPSRSEVAAGLGAKNQFVIEGPELEGGQDEEAAARIAGGRTRGVILHKLMEEVLTGETGEDLNTLCQRASELLAQLALAGNGISPTELTDTIRRTLDIQEVAALRPRLVPELTVYQSKKDQVAEIIVSGVADAVAYDAEGRIEVVVDWKTDVEIESKRLNLYRGQIDAYRLHTGATRALLVFMTAGKVVSFRS
jgi:ATP-dependent exoDNAse (exonuclease V) beta subunit